MKKNEEMRYCLNFKCTPHDLTRVGCTERDISHVGYIPTWLKSRFVCVTKKNKQICFI